MSKKQKTIVEYASPPQDAGRSMAWALAILAVLVPTIGSMVVVSVCNSPRLLTLNHARLLILGTSASVGTGGIVTGILGRHFAIKVQANAAGWVAIVGLLMGCAILVGIAGVLMIVVYFR